MSRLVVLALAFVLLSLILIQGVNASTDTDNDGYPDWMEELCGTNPNQPDMPTKDQIINAVVQKVVEYFSSTPDQRQTILNQVVELVIAYFNLPSEELILSDHVSYSGGSLNAGDLTVTFQTGTFSGNTEVKIYRIYENPFGSGAVSDGFRLETSNPITKPVEVRIRYSGSSDDAIVAVGEKSFISSLGKEEETYYFIPATISNGYATAEIPAMASISSSQTGIKASSTGYSFDLWVLTGYSKYETQHFRIYFPSSLAYSSAIEELGNALEKAYQTYKTMGFSYSARTKWPMIVVVKKLGSGVYGYYSSSVFGVNYGKMEINQDKLDNMEEMKITAGHEFFHFVQELYDPRSSISKAKGWFYNHYWLDEATAVWAEEKFSSSSNYISPVRSGNEFAPFNGMQAGAEIDARNHGYGMSALIKYLVKKHGERILVDIYNRIKAGDHPVDAIENAAGDPSDWYDDFLEEYILGRIYSDFTPLSNLAGRFTISSERDNHTAFMKSYPDLSGKLFLIRLSYPDMPENAVMRIKDDNVWGEITVFKVKSNAVEYLDSGYDDVTVSNLKELQDNGWNLLILETNIRAITPYTDEEQIKVEVNVTNLTAIEIWRGSWQGEFCWELDPSEDPICWNESGTWRATVTGTDAQITLYDDTGDVIGSGSGIWGENTGDSISIQASTDLMINPLNIVGTRVGENSVQGTWSVYDPDGSYATGSWSGTKE